MDAQAQEALNFIANNVGMERHAFGHFHKAMRAGYSTSPQKGTLVELPGSKTIEYRHNGWRVLDMYFVGPDGEYSGGTTTMWYGPIPIWMMQYLGRYEKEAIPCLKAALSSTYMPGQFNGGRGPDCFPYEGYVYINAVEKEGFVNAAGIERIFDLMSGREVGSHRYQSQWLVGRSAR